MRGTLNKNTDILIPYAAHKGDEVSMQIHRMAHTHISPFTLLAYIAVALVLVSNILVWCTAQSCILRIVLLALAVCVALMIGVFHDAMHYMKGIMKKT